MKEILLFVMAGCPHCRRALNWQEELQQEYPELKAPSVRIVDETEDPDYAATFDYYYVPTYFVDGEKLHEGAATKEKIESVLRAAL